jgi:hypothetical protein
MKAKTKSKTKKSATQGRSTSSRKSREPKKSIESRDLNEDEQDQITNIDKDDDLAVSAPENISRNTGFTVEEEEEREKRRKAEDINPEEPMK